MKTMQKSSKIWPEKDVHLVTVVLPRAPFWIFTKRLVSKNMCELIKKVFLQEQCHEIFNTKKKKKIKLGLMWTGRYDFEFFCFREDIRENVWPHSRWLGWHKANYLT